MASYKAAFDPPTRPGESGRSRRTGTYMHGEPPRMEHREADIMHMPGQMETHRGQSPMQRTQPTTLPKPSIREPSPVSTSGPEIRSKGFGGSFGFGKSIDKPSAGSGARELKGKSSRNVLRRKPSSIATQSGGSRPTIERSKTASPMKMSQHSGERRPSMEASLKSAEAYNEIFTRPRARTPAVKETPRIIPELDRYRTRPVVTSKVRSNAEVPHKLATQDLPPPTPLLSGTPLYSGGSSSHRYSGYSGSGYSASPSTRFSESPGPGGAYSRNTTPTSMSSQSPGIVVPLKINTPRLRQGSPATSSRPPLSRRRAGSTPNEIEEPTLDSQGLPSLRESINSSSSNSTVKVENKSKEKEKSRKKKRLSPPPPSPPPRKSSHKFKQTAPDQHESPSKLSRAPAKPVMASPSESAPVQRTISAQSEAKHTPPLRPSRDGAPDLRSQLGDSLAIMQSNLSGISLSPERRQSGVLRSTATSPLQTQPVLRPPQRSRLPSRNASPSPVQASQRQATPAPAGLGIIPDLRPQQAHSTSSGITSRTPSPSVNNSKPRFGLFGRRVKTTPEVATLDTIKDKALRKGPAAGTGHEGYGRYGTRGRSSSAGATGMSRDRSLSRGSSSQDSAAHDPFFLERMSPVIIAGGGEIIENRNASSELSRTESNTSLLLGRPSMDSRDSSKSNLSNEVSRTTLWPSALPREAPKSTPANTIPKGRRPSDCSDDGMHNSSLAFRRSMQRLNHSTGALHIPPPINIPSRGVSPTMSSMDASILSDESQMEMKVGRGRKDLPKKPKKLEKRAKSPRKWNFFHRSQPTSKSKDESAVPVTVGKPPAKTVAHYAMLDSSDEQQDPIDVDLEDILRDANDMELSNMELDALQFGNYKANIERIENLHSAIANFQQELPPTTRLEPTTAVPFFSSPEPIQITLDAPPTELHLGKEMAPTRPSRLPQVGRIPKVVSARPQATSPKSFSRPFARLSTSQPLYQPPILDKQSVALGQSPPKSLVPYAISQTTERQDFDKDPSACQSSIDVKSDTTTAASHQDFLVFPLRKNSEATTSSSSGGHSYAGTTAVIPETDAELAEDEVWDEYDDLIENDNTVKRPSSTTSSRAGPFEYEGYETRQMRKNKMKAKESPTLAPPPEYNEPITDESRRSNLTTSSHYSADMSSRMKDAFKVVPSPSTPMSFSDFFAEYGHRNNSVHDDSAQKPRRPSRSRSRKSSSSSHNSRSLSKRPISEQDVSPISQVNLRVGSMTVSKWLTFGHVLFSPAREQIMQVEGLSKRHSVLVLDGLGNDDWSFYAAETYPSSTFYNLSPTRPLSASQRTSTSASFPLTPPNHRQIQYTSPLHKFPFPSSTFTVVVFRFPSGMSEAAYRNIIAESKRVLKPGGYLEMAILDLDMMNMGNRARRAVRGLKVKIQALDPGMSLGSASDTVLRIVGRRGFGEIKSCSVGVPVASTVPSNKTNEKKDERSLADMMKDDSDAGDEGITKMVAKVGRWWYTRCYEMGVLPDADVSKSLFNDGPLLSECETWNSSFKLVVAYAQKPALGRRTSSV
ncbi:hypothetical protein LHYA1_G006006 [Lachnellula hyalina]|uniref:Methyltransferase type 11 domain-containing protein n=1 Tax=Lachnellula hyalina TaxID=1316788 RepID=A0A8H8R0X8_9HELO|nr:uncharacterized protein LHYA1_G006006 [Lachnellula hyalina]TVY26369.1 hypothetical protein LHYA1_G006006 [Lachnellula hyalina]